MDKTLKCRVGNIEFKYREFNKQYEIVRWQPNELYGKEAELAKDPNWHWRHGTWSKSIGGMWCQHGPSCFEHLESCYQIVSVRYPENDYSKFDLRTVGLRPWELDAQDEQDFKVVLEFVKQTPEILRAHDECRSE